MRLTTALILSALLASCSGASSPVSPSSLPSAFGPLASSGASFAPRDSFNDLPVVAGISCPSAAPAFEFTASGEPGTRHLNLLWQVQPLALDVEYMFERWNGVENRWQDLSGVRRAGVRERSVEVRLASLGVVRDEAGSYRATVRYRFRDGGCAPSAARMKTTSIDAPTAPVEELPEKELPVEATFLSDNIIWEG